MFLILNSTFDPNSVWTTFNLELSKQTSSPNECTANISLSPDEILHSVKLNIWFDFFSNFHGQIGPRLDRLIWKNKIIKYWIRKIENIPWSYLITKAMIWRNCDNRSTAKISNSYIYIVWERTITNYGLRLGCWFNFNGCISTYWSGIMTLEFDVFFGETKYWSDERKCVCDESCLVTLVW